MELTGRFPTQRLPADGPILIGDLLDDEIAGGDISAEHLASRSL